MAFDDRWGGTPPPEPSTDFGPALDFLVWGELIARRVSADRQHGVAAARAAGANWSQIGEALGVTKQAAWQSHLRWINEERSSPDGRITRVAQGDLTQAIQGETTEPGEDPMPS